MEVLLSLVTYYSFAGQYFRIKLGSSFIGILCRVFRILTSIPSLSLLYLSTKVPLIINIAY